MPENALDIECAEFLSLGHRFEFWGDIFNYRNIQNLTIRGRIEGDYLTHSPYAVWSGVERQTRTAYDWSPVSLNGHSVGSGRVISIDYDAGLDARNKPYRINLELLKSGNLFNLTGASYDGSSLSSVEGLEYVESFDENFSFSYNEEDASYAYSRNVSLSIESGRHSDPVSTAKSLADLFFLHDPTIAVLNAAYPNFYVGSGDRTKTETYDLQNFSFSFGEEFKFQSDTAYIWSYKHSLTLGQNSTTVSEQGEIIGVNDNPSIYSNAIGGFHSIRSGIYSRCNSAYQSWSDYISDTSLSGCPLKSTPTTRNVTSDQCRGMVAYNYTYTSDDGSDECSTTSHNISVSRGEDGIFSVSENGSICETCLTGDSRVSGALDTYNGGGFQSELTGRIENAYQQSYESLQCYSNSFPKELKLLSETTELSQYDGCVQYSKNYTDDTSYLTEGDFSQIKVERETTYPIHIVNKFPLVNFKEAVQPAYQSHPAQYTNKVTVVGRADQDLGALLEEADNYVLKPTDGVDQHMTDASYTWTPKTHTLELSVTYDYLQHRDFMDVLVW